MTTPDDATPLDASGVNPPLDLKLSETRCWVLLSRRSTGEPAAPLSAEEFLDDLRRMTEAPAEPFPGPVVYTLLATAGQRIECRVQADSGQAERWTLAASWPCDLRPFQLLVIEYAGPPRPPCRVSLQREMSSVPSSEPQTAPRHFHLALEGTRPRESDLRPGERPTFAVAWNDVGQELLISTERCPEDADCLPVLVNIDRNDRRLTVLYWMEQDRRFTGSIVVDDEQVTAGTLRCEIRELAWSDLPNVTAVPCDLATSGRRLRTVPLSSEGERVAFRVGDSLSNFAHDFPHALVMLKAGPPLTP